MQFTYKKAFFTLVAILLILGLFFVYQGTRPLDYTQSNFHNNTSLNSMIDIKLTLTAKELEILINDELEHESLDMTIVLAPQVEFSMPIEVYGQIFNFYLVGEPNVVEGNILVNVDKIQVGNLSLPIQTSLGLLEMALPESVPLGVTREGLMIQLDKLGKSQGITIYATEYDSNAKVYSFNLQMPKSMILQNQGL